MLSPADDAFVRALAALRDETACPLAARQLDRVFRLAYSVLIAAHAAAQRVHGRAAVEDATQNTLREFLQKLRGGTVDPERAPGLLRVMLWRRLRDERRRVARLRFGELDPSVTG
jgi:hypothetical protein